MLATSNLKKIKALEDVCLTMPQVDIETIERFMGTMYVREIFIPKGVTITSRVYKRAYVDIMLSGDIVITDTNGTYRLQGINILEGPAGRKRAGVALEDTRWITVHDSIDIQTSPIDDISFEQVGEYKNHEAVMAKKSYLTFLEMSGLSEDQVSDESKNEPYKAVETNDYSLGGSCIHGTGVFANVKYLQGQIVGPAVVDGSKTQLGRYVNHSGYPNTVYSGQNLMAIRAIEPGQEITVCYSFSERLLT